MMVWRDRETGPVHPSIGDAPSTGTFGMFLSVTTFMMTLLMLTGVHGIRNPRERLILSARAVARMIGCLRPERNPALHGAPGRGMRRGAPCQAAAGHPYWVDAASTDRSRFRGRAPAADAFVRPPGLRVRRRFSRAPVAARTRSLLLVLPRTCACLQCRLELL